MQRFADFVVKKRRFFIIISLILIIPSIIGYLLTRTNYDTLVYLPSDIETLKGQNILKDDFKLGAFSISIINNLDDYELSKIEEDIREIDCVNDVLSINATFTDFEDNYVVGSNKVCVKINGKTYQEDGKAKYFRVKDGKVDLTGIKLASGTKVQSVMLVTGDSEAYQGARATTTDIVVM